MTDEGAAAERDLIWMRAALELAREAGEQGEVPVGAVVISPAGEIVGRGHNRRETAQDPTAHAELLAIQEAAARLGSWRLVGCELFVTLEPCAMCAGAVVLGRLDRVVFGARDPKAGFCGSLGDLVRDPRLNHQAVVVEGVLAEESRELLQRFFAGLRREA